MSNTSRRTLLQSAAAFGATTAMSAWPLRQAAAAPPVRFLIFWTANGANQKQFWPSSGTTDSMILEPLGQLKSEISVIKNVTFGGTGDHKTGMPFSMTGFPTNPATTLSIDQAVAKETGKPALVLGGQGKSQNYRGWFSYDASGSPVLPTIDPKNAFTQVFGAPMGGVGGTPTPAPDASGYGPALQKKILAAALADAEDLRPRLPAAEALKLEQQSTALNRLAKALDGIDSGGSPGTPQPVATSCKTVDGGPWANPDGDYRKRIKLHLDLVALAFACDARRVASIMLSPGGHDSMGGPLGFLGVGGDIHNTIAHTINDNPDNHQKMANIKRWEVEQFAYLLQRLKSFKDSDGRTVLDNTVILFTNEVSDGNHGHRNIPVLVAGGGGRIATGKVLDAGGASRTYCELVLGLARATGANVSKFGEATAAWKPLVG